MGKITFDHAVIYNGVFYAAGAEITVKEPKEKPEKEAVKKNDNRTGKNTKPRNTAD